MQVPADFTTGLLIEPASDGQIAVGFAKDGTLMGDFTLSPLDVANMAAALLGASKDVSNQLPEREDQTDNSGALVAPSSISLGPGRIPGEHALIFSFGESHLALPLDPGAMKSLGETMVTLSATGRVQ